MSFARRAPPSSLRALVLMTAALCRRMLREGLILRSLTFPSVLTVGTLVATIGFVAWLRWEPTVVVTPELAHLQPILIERGLKAEVAPDPEARVLAETAWGGTDGRTLWLAGGGPKALIFESVVREAIGARWRPDSDVPKPGMRVATAMGSRITTLLGALFALYGVVFGAGMVARDRDSGTFEIELSLPLPRWMPGATRMLAGGLLLSVFLTLAVLLVNAVLGVPDVWASARNGIACAFGATSVGLLVVGRNGLQNGFTGPLASGSSIATALIGFGVASPGPAKWVPIASFATQGSGWEALGGTIVLSLATLALFTWRSART